MGYAIVRLWFKWLLEQPDGKQTDKLGDLYFLEESYETNLKNQISQDSFGGLGNKYVPICVNYYYKGLEDMQTCKPNFL